MRILIIDGQGGGIGARLVSLLRPRLPEGCELLCTGTNSLATSAMLKAGAARGATGEHAICYNAQRADLILGPIGVILANGIMGEASSPPPPAAPSSPAPRTAGWRNTFAVRWSWPSRNCPSTALLQSDSIPLRKKFPLPNGRGNFSYLGWML